MMDNYGHMDDEYRRFFDCESSGQLAMLNTIVTEQIANLGYTEQFLHFLAVVFLESPSKHPVKGYITKIILKSEAHVGKMYVAVLCGILERFASHGGEDIINDMQLISKISKCLEVDLGVIALETVAHKTIVFFKQTLKTAVTVFYNRETSPTLKKDITFHCHHILRLLLLPIQRFHSNGNFGRQLLDLVTIASMKHLLNHEEMPMDTKSLCGIILVKCLVLEVGEVAAIEMILVREDNWMRFFLTNDTEQLVVYNGLSTKPPLPWTELWISGLPAIIKVLDEFVAIGERAICDSAMTLTVGRAINQLAKYLGFIDSCPQIMGGILVVLPKDHIGPIDSALAEKLEAYVLTVMEHSMDSVRHLAGRTLVLIANFYNKHEKYEKIILLMDNFIHPIKRSYFLIAEKLISNLRTIPEKVFMAIIDNCIMALYLQDVQAVAATCLDGIISNTSGDDSRYLTIITKLLHCLKERSILGMSEALVFDTYHRLLSKILTLDERTSVQPLLQKINDLKYDPYISDSELVCVLVIMRADQNVFLEDTIEPQLTSPDYTLLRKAATHPKEEYRILALSIVVDSKKTTKCFQQSDFSFVLYFLKYNANTQSHDFTQLMLPILKQFVKRLADSLPAVQRDTEEDEEPPTTSENCYAQFVSGVRSFCFENLALGANTGRRFALLQLVAWIDSTDLPNTRMFMKSDVEVLLNCLKDNYARNMQLAFDILLTCPSSLLQENTYSVSLSLEAILQEASSMKSVDYMSAGHKLILLEKKFNKDLLSVVLARLKTELAVAQKSMVLAASQAPMCGLVHCLRKLIDNDPRLTEKSLINDLFNTLMEVNMTVTPIVYDSSPEGQLPMDLGEHQADPATPSCPSRRRDVHQNEDVHQVDDESLSDDHHSDDETNDKLMAQKVLLCAWRSVKEVSLLLGELCYQLPSGSLYHERLKATGEHFINLLSETKHRGAFEQAYVGFTMFLPRLWASKSPALHSLPYTWLKEMISQICSSNNLLCPTRRSAGLPFIIQALVVTELKSSGGGKYFHLCINWLLRNAGTTKLGAAFTLETFNDDEPPLLQVKGAAPLEGAACTFSDRLFCDENENDLHHDKVPENNDVAKESSTVNPSADLNEGNENGGAQSDSVKMESRVVESVIERGLLEFEVRTHCLNILRALYRNSDLGEVVSGKVQEGLMVAICGLNAEKFQERSSASLLLDALIVRVFGVQRTKCHEKLSLRNKMTARIFFMRYPAMYQFILDVMEYAEEKRSKGEICHSLSGVLLILARLYQLEGTDSNLKLCGFVEGLMRCASSPHMALRKMSAKAIASIVPPHHWHIQVMKTYNKAVLVQRDSNHLHGLLMQLSLLLDNAPESLPSEWEWKLEFSLHLAFKILFRRECDQRYTIRNELLNAINNFAIRFKRIVIKKRDVELLTNDLINPTDKMGPYYNVYVKNLVYYTNILHFNQIENGTTNTYQFTAAEGGLYEAMETKKLRILTTVPDEILFAELNILLIFTSGSIDEQPMCAFETHIQTLLKKPRTRMMMTQYLNNRKEILYECLRIIIKLHYNWQCRDKSLMLLNSFDGTAKKVIESISPSNIPVVSVDDVARQLYRLIRNSDSKPNIRCLQALLNFLSVDAENLKKSNLLMCLRLVCKHSTFENTDNVRAIVAKFICGNFDTLLNMSMAGYTNSNIFEHKALVWCTLMTLLEDDSQSTREAAAVVVSKYVNHKMPMMASAAAESLRDYIATRIRDMDERIALMTLMALYDFRAEVCKQDQHGDTSSVFDQSERHNVHLEESAWTKGFVSNILRSYKKRTPQESIKDYLNYLVEHPDYKRPMDTLCNDNLAQLKKYLQTNEMLGSELCNPKVKLFASMLD